jgi:8-amino-7-oxononanoate synthase
VHVYRHANEDHLAQLLDQTAGSRRRLIVSDSLFSMDGDDAPMNALPAIAEKYGAILMIDEAHATGAYGEQGRGYCEWFGVEELVPVRVGTLSKALGSSGGFVVGARRLIDWLSNRARPYGFSTAAPPAAAAAGLKAIEIVQQEPQRRLDLQAKATKLRQALGYLRMGYSTTSSHIVPVILGDPDRAITAAANLRRRGFLVPAIRPPSVPEGQSLLRISLTCLHTEQQIDGLVAAMCEVVG